MRADDLGAVPLRALMERNKDVDWTITRLCGSGLDALGSAGRAIRAGADGMMIAGGVESSTGLAVLRLLGLKDDEARGRYAPR